MIKFELEGELLKLLPEKAIYWERLAYLIISDLHLGKAGHFRRNGIPISRNVHFEDLRILENLLRAHKPTTVVLLGDLFHSFKNNEWDDFLKFIDVYDFVKFILVKGNHDILGEYPKRLQVVDFLEVSPFMFTHEREASPLYNLSGHVHPGYRVRGLGRGGVTLPCFLFSSDYGVLPAFGQFTGIHKIRKKERDRIFGIVDNSVMELI